MPSGDPNRRLSQPFDYPGGRDTLRSLHLIWEIVGKVRMTLFTSSRGFTTRPIPYKGMTFEIDIDLLDMVCRVVTSDGRSAVVPLETLIAVFYESFADALAGSSDPYGECLSFYKSAAEVFTRTAAWELG